jgi:hypothetical protein
LFLEQAMLGLSSPDVMKFLGHRVNVSGQIPAHFGGELTMDFKSRATGDRVKYRMDGLSLKGYGKASTQVGDLFRVENHHPKRGVLQGLSARRRCVRE